MVPNTALVCQLIPLPIISLNSSLIVKLGFVRLEEGFNCMLFCVTPNACKSHLPWTMPAASVWCLLVGQHTAGALGSQLGDGQSKAGSRHWWSQLT